MRMRKRSLGWFSLCLAAMLLLGSAGVGAAGQPDLSYFQQAKINWKQFAGQRLTIGLNKHPYTESLLPLIPEFEALTGIKVDYLILPENEYGSKLTADLSQQRGEFTVIMAGAMRNWAYVTPGWMVPLDDFLKNPKLTDPAWYKVEDFFPSLIAANRWNGTVGGGTGQGPLWSIPVMAESYILPYRKDLFDQYKIKVPTTYEELAEAARLVKRHAGIDGVVARGTANFPTIATGYLSGIKSYTDGKWAELDEKLNAQFHDPRAVKFTQIWTDMLRESGPANWANMTWYDAMETFAAGQAGMYPDCDFFAATYEDPKKSKIAGKVGYALLPAGPGGKTYSGLFTWALGMSKATKNKEAAWYFIQWATSPRTLLNATIEFRNYNPTRISVMNHPETKKVMGGWGNGTYLPVVQKNLETARIAWVPEPERPRLGDTWARALHEIYFKRLPADQAMKRATDEVNKIFTEIGLRK
ncbi:MAG: ABC transporter substrate-binding protein [Candidatus Methylomirabilales bacterium]